MTGTALQAREQFKTRINKCFYVSAKDAIQTNQIDKKRSDVAKESDIIFLADQLGDRKMMFTTKDRKYEKVVKKVEQKKQKILLRKQNEKRKYWRIIIIT
jgi:hypothetical protein